jgi:hypothetical protein
MHRVVERIAATIIPTDPVYLDDIDRTVIVAFRQPPSATSALPAEYVISPNEVYDPDHYGVEAIIP